MKFFHDALDAAKALQTQVADAAQPHLDAAHKGLAAVVETGKAAIDDGAATAQPLIAKLAEQSKNVLDATHAAITNATKPPSS